MKLIFKRAAPDAFTASAGACGVTSLDHEVLDQAVEDGVVVLALIAQTDKVLRGAGYQIAVDLQVESAQTCDKLHVAFLAKPFNTLIATGLDLLVCCKVILFAFLW